VIPGFLFEDVVQRGDTRQRYYTDGGSQEHSLGGSDRDVPDETVLSRVHLDYDSPNPAFFKGFVGEYKNEVPYLVVLLLETPLISSSALKEDFRIKPLPQLVLHSPNSPEFRSQVLGLQPFTDEAGGVSPYEEMVRRQGIIRIAFWVFDDRP
jgi:hypothetical protein